MMKQLIFSSDLYASSDFIGGIKDGVKVRLRRVYHEFFLDDFVSSPSLMDYSQAKEKLEEFDALYRFNSLKECISWMINESEATPVLIYDDSLSLSSYFIGIEGGTGYTKKVLLEDLSGRIFVSNPSLSNLWTTNTHSSLLESLQYYSGLKYKFYVFNSVKELYNWIFDKPSPKY